MAKVAETVGPTADNELGKIALKTYKYLFY